MKPLYHSTVKKMVFYFFRSKVCSGTPCVQFERMDYVCKSIQNQKRNDRARKRGNRIAIAVTIELGGEGYKGVGRHERHPCGDVHRNGAHMTVPKEVFPCRLLASTGKENADAA